MLIRHLWQLKTVVFLHWCLICAVLFYGKVIIDIKKFVRSLSHVFKKFEWNSKKVRKKSVRVLRKFE